MPDQPSACDAPEPMLRFSGSTAGRFGIRARDEGAARLQGVPETLVTSSVLRGTFSSKSDLRRAFPALHRSGRDRPAI